MPNAPVTLLQCVNIPLLITILVNNKMATYHELDTFYSLEDAWNLLEILQVSRYNENKLMEHSRKNDKRNRR